MKPCVAVFVRKFGFYLRQAGRTGINPVLNAITTPVAGKPRGFDPSGGYPTLNSEMPARTAKVACLGFNTTRTSGCDDPPV
jgi:hypothetical protein